jgi:hypothetical protein
MTNPMSEVLGVGIMSGNVVNVHVKDAYAAVRVRDYISALVLSPVEQPKECICPTCGLRHGGSNVDGGF